MIRSVIRPDRIFVKRIVDVLGLRTYNDRRLATSGVEMAGAIFDKSLAGAETVYGLAPAERSMRIHIPDYGNAYCNIAQYYFD